MSDALPDSTAEQDALDYVVTGEKGDEHPRLSPLTMVDAFIAAMGWSALGSSWSVSSGVRPRRFSA